MLSRTVARTSVSAGAALLIASLLTAPTAVAQVAAGGDVVIAGPGPTAVDLVSSWDLRSGPQGPQEVRIMTRIIRTALEGVEPPELPEALQPEKVEEGEGETARSLARAYSIVVGELGGFDLSGSLIVGTGERGVTGFYMKGYGYLFNIRWHIGVGDLNVLSLGERGELLVALEEQNKAMQRILADRVARRSREQAGGEDRLKEAQHAAQEAVKEEREKRAAREAALAAWRGEYTDALVETLKEVMATYGSTLNQVQPDEAITFIAEFGREEEESVTLTLLGREIGGPGAQARDRILDAIRISRGGSGAGAALKSQMRIMSEIINAAFEEAYEGEVMPTGAYVMTRRGSSLSLRRDTDYQYIQGYGVIFRRRARRTYIRTRAVADETAAPEPERLFLRYEEQLEESKERQAEHLENLKRKTAEIFATYGASMTELSAEEWLSIHYDVGGATQLLQGGPDYFLVQAKMSDVRTAAGRQDGSDWLLGQLITNERQE